MVPSQLTAPFVPKYRPDIRLTSFGGIPKKARIFQTTSRFTEQKLGERLADVHRGYKQPTSEVTQTLSEDMEWKDAIYRRLLGCESRLIMALVS